MKLKSSLLAISLGLFLAVPAMAQQQVTVIGPNSISPSSATNPFDTRTDINNAQVSASNPFPVQVSQGNSAIGTSNPVPVQLTNGSAVNANSAAIFNTPSSTTLANTTSLSGSVGGTAASTSLTASSTSIKIRNTHASQILYFALTGTATTSSFGIPAGAEETITVGAGVTSISLIGSGSSTTFSLFAD